MIIGVSRCACQHPPGTCWKAGSAPRGAAWERLVPGTGESPGPFCPGWFSLFLHSHSSVQVSYWAPCWKVAEFRGLISTCPVPYLPWMGRLLPHRQRDTDSPVHLLRAWELCAREGSLGHWL